MRGTKAREGDPGRRTAGCGNRRCAALTATLAILACAIPDALAQKAVPAGQSLRGTVVDAATGQPLEGSVVVLRPALDGLLAPGRSRSSLWTVGLTTVTGAEGEYAFHELPPGPYTIDVTRLAYRPARVDIEVSRVDVARVSVGLIVEPILMEPQDVAIRVSPPAATTGWEPTGISGDERLALERARQAHHLASDAREVSRADVVEAITLAEIDVFRALQRLPGVTTRDDFTAGLWTRGAPWSHTRVTFDGLPLFNPLHGVGVFSGVNSDAIGAVRFHPGSRSAALGEGAAGVVDIISRPAGGSGELRGLADVSLVTARGALDRPIQAGRGGWMVAARRSYLDLLTLAIEKIGGGSDVHIPYSFHDLTARLDVDLGGGKALEASAIWEEDRVTGDVTDILEANRSRWGNAGGRATFTHSLDRLRLRHTIGASRFLARVIEQDPDSFVGQSDSPDDSMPGPFRAPGEEPTESRITHFAFSTEIGPDPAIDGSRWSAGIAMVAEGQRYDGPAPTPYPGRTSLKRVELHEDLARLALWGERRWQPTGRLEIETGLRLEAGHGAANAGRYRLAPRALARYALAESGLLVSAGWSRVFQYAQVLAPAGLSVGPRLHPSDLWLLAADSFPALRSDIVTLGAERWLGEAWLASATAYWRRTIGLVVPDPTPGPVDPLTRFAVGVNRARGIEISARRLAGSWSGMLAYAYGVSKADAVGRSYPAPADRRHAVDISAMVRAGPRLRFGGAFTWTSGAPFTRFFAARFFCPAINDTCEIDEPAVVEEPNAERAADYASLDVLVEWTRAYDGWELGIYGQIRNLLGRENAITYRGSRRRCEAEDGSADATSCSGEAAVTDEFDGGLPILPAVGVRFSF